LHVVLDSDVARHSDRISTHDLCELLRRLGQSPRMPVADRDDRALFSASLRGSESDARPGSGSYEDALASEQTVSEWIRRRA
jgi:hypothetical protein